jgi:hypothetical protein
MKITSAFYKVTAPEGEYFVGDPCYAVPNEQWDELLESCDYFNSPIGRAGEYEVLAFSTQYGDGTYGDTAGYTYSVDSGMIGITPMAMTTKTREELERLGRIVNFERPVLASNHRDGRIVFSGIEIDTGEQDDDEGGEW